MGTRGFGANCANASGKAQRSRSHAENSSVTWRLGGRKVKDLDDCFDDLATYVGQPVIAALELIGQPLVIDA